MAEEKATGGLDEQQLELVEWTDDEFAANCSVHAKTAAELRHLREEYAEEKKVWRQRIRDKENEEKEQSEAIETQRYLSGRGRK